MLLSDRRIALLHITLAALDITWFLPFVAAWGGSAAAAPLATWGRLLIAELAWMLALDLLDLRFDDKRRRAFAIGLFIISTLLVLWQRLHADTPLWSLRWLGESITTMVNLEAGLTPDAVLLLTCGFLWLRASWSLGRNLSTLGIERSFSADLALMLGGGALARALNGFSLPAAIPVLLCAAGLTAMALAHSDERAALAHTRGRRLPMGRLAQALGFVAFTAAASWRLAIALPAVLIKVIGYLGFGVELIAVAFQVFFITVVVAGARVVQWIAAKFGVELQIGSTQAPQMGALLPAELNRMLAETTGRDVTLPPWVLALIQYLPLAIVLALVILVFLLVARRVYRRRRGDEAERQSALTPSGSPLRQGLAQVRGFMDMVRRFGLGRQLLAAISIEAIYANLSRLAAQRGHPRPPAQPPDLYLPTLCALYEDCDKELGRITAAYMQVHYGDQPLARQELLRVQSDYSIIRHAERHSAPDGRGDAATAEG